MSYLVLARKWRPQRFEEVIGQQPIIQTLQNAIRSNRVAHVFLFAGPRGVGKTSVARILAKALNCAQGPTPHPCNQCDACLEITKGIAPDVFEIDGASNTGVDNVRDLQETIKYLPQKHRYKIYIVDEVHMLSNPAFNAFLKTLEEPPPHVIFIFATTEPHKIIETVLDRCQRYDFKKIPSNLIFQKLEEIAREEGIVISPEALQIISRAAEGSLRDAQSLLDQVIAYAGTQIRDKDVAEVLGIVDNEVLVEISRAVLNQDLKKLVEVVENVFNYGFDIRQFYQSLLEHFRNLLVAKVGNHSQIFSDFSAKEIEELTIQVQRFSLEKLQLILKILMENEGYLYRTSLPQVILETIVLRLATIPNFVSLKEVIERLNQLQEKLLSEKKEKTSSSPNFSLPENLSQINNLPPDETWKNLLKFIRTKKPLLASLLEHGKLINLNLDSIEIGFPPNSFFLERIQEKSKKQELMKICEEFFGKRKEIIFSSPESNKTKEEETLPLAQRNEKLREEAKNHPKVKEVLNMFGGTITEIKIKKD